MSDILNSILDSNLDDLADLPEFKVFPDGVHEVTIKWESKEINGKPAIELKLQAVQTIELANPAADNPLNQGDESSCLFFLGNEFSEGSLKKLLKQLASQTGTTSLRETMDASNGMQINAVCKVRYNKDKSQSYTSVVRFDI